MTALIAAPASAEPLRYSGTLVDMGTPAEGDYALRMSLYDSPTGGRLVAEQITLADVPVRAGRFTTSLDFGMPQTMLDRLWMQVEVAGPDGRFESSGKRESLDAKALATAACWSIDGNAGTSAPLNFVGTLDPTPLVLAVNDRPAFRLEPTAGTPNVIGGLLGAGAGNLAVPGTEGVTISGGGATDGLNNYVGDDFGTIGGGRANRIEASNSTEGNVGGTIAGGQSNIVSARNATVGGGNDNQVGGEASVVAGGESNVAPGTRASIGGGRLNTAEGPFSSISGGTQNLVEGVYSTIGGGSYNAIGPDGDFATIGGGSSNESTGVFAVVGGGTVNFATSTNAVIGGGQDNRVNGIAATIPGGRYNCAGGTNSFAAGYYAVVRSPAGGPSPCPVVGIDADGDEGSFIWSDFSPGTFSTSGSNQFLVRAGGGMGINMNKPASSMHVRHALYDPLAPLVATPDPGSVITAERDSGNVFISIIGAANAQRGILFGEPGSAANGAITYDNGNTAAMEFRTNGNVTRMRIDADGATRNTTGAWSTLSDARVKRGIADIVDPLATLLSLRGHRFEYTEAAPMMAPGLRLGFVAQEVREALPEWVREGSDGFLSVTPTGFEALAVEAMLELAEENDRLRQELAELRALVAGDDPQRTAEEH